MIDRIKRPLREQDWRRAATIGGVTASLGAVWTMSILPGTLCPELGVAALLGALVAMATEGLA